MKNAVKHYREEKGLTQEELAERVGTSQQQIQRLENGERRLTEDWIKKLSAALEVSPMVFFAENTGVTVKGRLSETGGRIFKAAGTVPVYGYAPQGEDGLIINPNFIAEYAETPSQLHDIKDGFMVYVSGDAMIPRYFQGEKIIIHPTRLPKPGEDCLIVRKDEQAFIRVYRGQSGNIINTERYNPAADEEFEKSSVKGIYAVIGRY